MGSITLPWVSQTTNLHNALIPNADGPDVVYRTLPDPSIASGSCSIIFRDHFDVLKREILNSEFVLIAAAWFTNEPLLHALRFVPHGCAVLVQKEDFLRPDVSVKPRDWHRNLRKTYESLHCDLIRYELPYPISALNTNGDPSVDPVRCVGNHNANKEPAMPRMHHKFAVFFKVQLDDDEVTGYQQKILKPYAVWTGSLNWTHNAEKSFENAVLIRDPRIAMAFAQEWANVYSLSEPLDWTSSWVAPQHRIGT
jgi:hypothetical protein